jgi:D-alanyl-D-alanine carboxypeptidase
MPSPFSEDLEEHVIRGMEDCAVPGAALAVIENGRPTFTGCWGYKDIETKAPVGDDTLFALQSISKSYAGIAVMMLVEEGRLELDDPVERHLQRWRFPPSPFNHDAVTVRRLLAHQAGVSSAGFPGIAEGYEAISLIDGLNGIISPFTDEQDAYWNEWSLDRDWPVRISTTPGDGWRYSNGGFGVLQIMIEDITGISYETFVQRRIMSPLGMNRSTFAPFDDPDLAEPHGPGGHRRRRYRTLCAAAGGVYASIHDLAAFACAEIALPGGGGLLSQAAAAELWKPAGLADRSGDVQFEAALGHLVYRSAGRLNVHHSGGTIGWRSIYSVFPETGDGLCMIMNSDQGNPFWIPLIRRWRESLLEGR